MKWRIISRYKGVSIQVRASFWFLVCSFLQKGVTVITTPIFTRIMTTDEYGQFNNYLSWYAILTAIVTLYLSAGVYTQGLIKFEEKAHVFSSSLQGLTLILCLFWFVLYILFNSFWNELFGLTTIQMISMFVSMWATASFSFWAAEQRVKLKYRALVFFTIIVSCLSPFVSILFVISSDDKVTARIVGSVLVELFCYAVAFFIQLRKGKKFFSRKYWKYALMFNIPLLPHYLSQTVLSSADRIMITDMIGSSEAGVYSLAYSISHVMLLFNTAFMATIGPWIYQKIKEKRTAEISKIAYISIIGIAGLNICLIAVAPEILFIFAPSSYQGAIYAIPPVAMSVYFLYLYDLFARFEFYYEKTKWIALATACSAFLNIILNYIFIDIFGYVAAAYTTLICYILYACFHYIMMAKVCKKEMEGIHVYKLKIILSISIAFLICCFVLALTYNYYPVFRFGIILLLLVISVCLRKKIKNMIYILMGHDKR